MVRDCKISEEEYLLPRIRHKTLMHVNVLPDNHAHLSDGVHTDDTAEVICVGFST